MSEHIDSNRMFKGVAAHSFAHIYVHTLQKKMYSLIFNHEWTTKGDNIMKEREAEEKITHLVLMITKKGT